MIVLIGESASGKTSIEKELADKGYSKIISYTTRPKRSGESNGIDYHYVSDAEFEQMLNNKMFAEFTKYNGWYYGIAKEDCVDNAVVVVEPHGFRQLQKIKDLHITSFYIKTSEHTRLARFASRGDNVMEIFRRIVSDQGVFQGIENEVTYVINGEKKLSECVNEIIQYLSIMQSKHK